MRNKYEFKIEEINEVVATSDGLTLKYKRINDSLFEETFHGTPSDDGVEHDKDGKTRYTYICPRCGAYNYVYAYEKPEIPTSADDVKCEYCLKGYREWHSEENMIGILNSFMKESTYMDLDLTINDIHIV